MDTIACHGRMDINGVKRTKIWKNVASAANNNCMTLMER
jgi:hypothetical protein